MGQPEQPVLAVDPNLQAEQDRAAKALTDQLQTEASGDTASLMARFGSRLALQGSATAPMVTPT